MATFSVEQPSRRFGSTGPFAGHMPDFGVLACSTILFMHFGVRTERRDLKPRM